MIKMTENHRSEHARTNKQKLLGRLINTPRFLSYDVDGRGIEVKPGRYSPIYINMKSLWCYPLVLRSVTSQIKEMCLGCDHIIGVETGGSPYASLIARDLNIPLILLRKEAKGSLGYLAGYARKQSGKFAIVDDVLATGNSIKEAVDSIRNDYRKIKLVSVLSYGMDQMIAEKYNIEVVSLYQIEDVLSALNPDLSELLTPHIRTFQDNLASILRGS